MIIIKTYISILGRTTRFWNNLHQERSKSKDWKVPKENSRNRLRSPMSPMSEVTYVTYVWGHLCHLCHLCLRSPMSPMSEVTYVTCVWGRRTLVRITITLFGLSISINLLNKPCQCKNAGYWADDTLGATGRMIPSGLLGGWYPRGLIVYQQR